MPHLHLEHPEVPHRPVGDLRRPVGVSSLALLEEAHLLVHPVEVPPLAVVLHRRLRKPRAGLTLRCWIKWLSHPSKRLRAIMTTTVATTDGKMMSLSRLQPQNPDQQARLLLREDSRKLSRHHRPPQSPLHRGCPVGRLSQHPLQKRNPLHLRHLVALHQVQDCPVTLPLVPLLPRRLCPPRPLYRRARPMMHHRAQCPRQPSRRRLPAHRLLERSRGSAYQFLPRQ